MKTRTQLTPDDHGRPITLEEFDEADALEGYRYEIIEGKVYVTPAPRFAHEDLRHWLFLLMNGYAEEHPAVINYISFTGRVFVPRMRTGVTAPEPDLIAYRGFPRHLPRSRVNWRDVSPVLVAEVISPDTADKDLTRNRRLYLRVPSILEYWMIDTRADYDRPSLIALRRDGQRWADPIAVPFGGIYTTPLLPGFTLAIDPRPGAA